MMRAPLTLIVGGILLSLTEGDSYSGVHYSGEDWDDPEALAAGAVGLLCCCIGLGIWVLNCLMQVGFAGATQRVMVTGEERFSDLFRERGLWLSMVLARILKFALIVAATLPFLFMIGGPLLLADALDSEGLGAIAAVFFGLAYFPIWFFVFLGLVLVEQAVAVESLAPVAALQRSWEVAKGNRFSLLVFLIVTFLVQLAGLLACCVGVLFTAAWSYTAWYEAYIRFALPAPAEGMWSDTPDPLAPVAPVTPGEPVRETTDGSEPSVEQDTGPR